MIMAKPASKKKKAPPKGKPTGGKGKGGKLDRPGRGGGEGDNRVIDPGSGKT
jgi:hypothetical protein